ncbi:hypothetical protein DRW03_34400 [Corallococcus sp. H22C18031201]|nr:hypothetical protein DRW03_34400 [Corallococcus sp. H22C18031201]
MTDIVVPARAVSDAVEIAAPPNTPFVVQEPRCVKAPCLVCWLRARVAVSPSTAGATFSTTPLQLNLVGVRSEDSLSNRFDDVMVVFFQLLPSSSRAAFEAAIEEELQADMATRVEEMARAANGCFRTVACSQQGLWVVGLFTVTTDPGFEDSPEALEAQRAKYQRALAEAEAKVKRFGVEEPTLTRARAEARSARTALLARGKKGVVPVAPVLPTAVGDIAAPTRDRASLDEFLRAVEQRLGELRAAREVRRTHPSWVERTEAALAKKVAENEERKGHVPTFQYHKGWVEQGRAILPVGHYPDAYRFYLHKAGTSEGFPRATVALAVPAIEAGTRVYSVKYLCTAPERKLRGRFSMWQRAGAVYLPRDVVQVWSRSGLVTRYALGHARLELSDLESTEAFRREASIVTHPAGTRTPLSMDAQVVIADSVYGTNIHRAHHVRLSSDRTRLEGEAARDETEVNNWSEGCQTFADFFEFSGAIRLSAISKRWLCASASPGCVGAEACQRLSAGAGSSVPRDAELVDGETVLVQRFGVHFILRALASECLKSAESLAHRSNKARQERARIALTEEEARQLEALEAECAGRGEAPVGRSKPSGLSTRERVWLSNLQEKKRRSEEDESAKRIGELDAEIQAGEAAERSWRDSADDALNEVRLGELPNEIQAADADIRRCESALEEIEDALAAARKKGAKALSVHQRRRYETSRAETQEDLEASRLRKAELEAEEAGCKKSQGLGDATLQRRRDFLRERAQTFRADFLRRCDLLGQCKVRQSYTLIECAPPSVSDLKALFMDARNGVWDGRFVMGDEGDAP